MGLDMSGEILELGAGRRGMAGRGTKSAHCSPVADTPERVARRPAASDPDSKRLVPFEEAACLAEVYLTALRQYLHGSRFFSLARQSLIHGGASGVGTARHSTGERRRGGASSRRPGRPRQSGRPASTRGADLVINYRTEGLRRPHLGVTPRVKVSDVRFSTWWGAEYPGEETSALLKVKRPSWYSLLRSAAQKQWLTSGNSWGKRAPPDRVSASPPRPRRRKKPKSSDAFDSSSGGQIEEGVDPSPSIGQSAGRLPKHTLHTNACVPMKTSARSSSKCAEFIQ